MIPNLSELLSIKFEESVQPSKNYKMNLQDERVIGFVDNLESMTQVIYKILNTERYQYIIYSWNYGIELSNLIGRPVDYVQVCLERRVKEALLQDSRINSISDFATEKIDKKTILATFTVNTIFGRVDIEKEVEF